MSTASVIGRFRACEGSLELLALEGQGALDLLQSNPLAGFCLAVNWKFRPPPVVCPLSAAWELVYQPQRRILEWLGFPGTEAMAKLGRKCVPVSLTLDRCLRLRRALTAETNRRLLAHLPRINAGVIDLVAQRELQLHVTPHLLAEIAQNQNEDQGAPTAPLLTETRRMARTLRRRAPAVRVRSRQQLREVHDELVQELNRRRTAGPTVRPFPEPPVPGLTSDTLTITPITTVDELETLGREQHNCVAAYATPIYRHEVYIYRVTRGAEVCTLAIAPTSLGDWTVQQLKGVCNQDATAATDRAVRLWLARHQAARRAADPTVALAPVPIPGMTSGSLQIEPVTNATGLEQLAASNCQRRIITGGLFIYRVTAPEGVCTLHLRRGDLRTGWELDRVEPAGAHRVRGETLRTIADWLGRSQRRFR